MADPLRVASVGFVRAAERHREVGLLGYVTVTLNDALLLDGLTLRRTLGGRLVLSYPERTDARGYRHSVVRPLDDHARRELERQVFDALGIEPEAQP